MSRKNRGGGNTALFVIVLTLGLLMFFGVITFNTRDFNDFINLLRGMWK